MQKSTPLDHLRRDDGGMSGGGDAAQQMMDDVVHDLEGGGGYPGDYPPDQQFDPRMGGGLPPGMGGPMPGYEQFQGGGGGGPPPGYQGGPPPGFHGGPPPGYGGPPPPGARMHPGAGGGPPLENASFSQKLMSQAKEPLLVAVLVVILSSSQVHQLIARFLPIAAANPFVGLVIRAVIAGVAFWLLRRFIPN